MQGWSAARSASRTSACSRPLRAAASRTRCRSRSSADDHVLPPGHMVANVFLRWSWVAVGMRVIDPEDAQTAAPGLERDTERLERIDRERIERPLADVPRDAR